jgi:hypothetical protein
MEPWLKGVIFAVCFIFVTAVIVGIVFLVISRRDLQQYDTINS